jgi:hypothetical protein
MSVRFRGADSNRVRANHGVVQLNAKARTIRHAEAARVGTPAVSRRLDQRRHAVPAKQDRAYEDVVEGRITEEFRTRESQ